MGQSQENTYFEFWTQIQSKDWTETLQSPPEVSFHSFHGWFSNTPYHCFLRHYPKIPTLLHSDLREDSEDTSLRLDVVRCQKRFKNPSVQCWHCLGDCNPQSANGPAAFVTSQRVNRPVWTEYFLENSCPQNLILVLKTFHPCPL